MQIYWKKRKAFASEKSSTPKGLVWDTNMAAVSLFWDTNMADVKTLYRLSLTLRTCMEGV